MVVDLLLNDYAIHFDFLSQCVFAVCVCVWKLVHFETTRSEQSHTLEARPANLQQKVDTYIARVTDTHSTSTYTRK